MYWGQGAKPTADPGGGSSYVWATGKSKEIKKAEWETLQEER